MPDTGTGTDPTTDRCPDCGHPRASPGTALPAGGCGCGCCYVVSQYEWLAFLLGWRE